MKYLKLMIITIVLVTIAMSCGDHTTEPQPKIQKTDSIFTDIKWQNGTVTFENSDTSAVISYDENFDKIILSANNEKAQNLKVDDIIFIYGKTLKKVSNITIKNDRIEVETEYCRLNEAIKDGKIYWNKGLTFPPSLIPGIKVDYKKPYTQVVNGKEFSIDFPIGNGMDGKITMTLNDDRLDASCEITKKSGVANMKYAFEGFVNKIQSEGDIDYQEGKLKSFSYQNSDVNGEMTLSLVATGSTNDLLNGIELPIVLMKIPMMVGGIPCVFNLKMLFVINTIMPTLDASAFIKTKFKYNSTTGITYNGTSTGVIANAGPITMDSNKDSIHVASSQAIGVNFGFTFPRLELGIFGETIVPYIHTAFLIGGSYTFGTKSCLKIDASYIGAVGYNFDFLGLIKFSGDKTLWQKDKNLKKSGDCD